MAAKIGRPRKPKEDKVVVTTMTSSLRELIRRKTDWDKFLDILTKMAYGGEKAMNQNGIPIITRPNLDALRMMAEYAWGKPTNDASDESAEALKQVAAALSSIMLPSLSQLSDVPSDKKVKHDV